MAAEENENSIDRLTSKVQDHSSVLQAIQVDIKHLVKGFERLVGVGEKQAELGHQLDRHSESIERAFKHMDSVESKLAQAIRELNETFKLDRVVSSTLASEIAAFKSSMRTAKWMMGGYAALILIIGGMFTNSLNKDIARAEASANAMQAKQDRDSIALAIKVDTLSQQVQEVRLDRQRDREMKDSRP